MKLTYERLAELVAEKANRIGELEHQLKNAERIMAGKNARIAELEAEVERLTESNERNHALDGVPASLCLRPDREAETI